MKLSYNDRCAIDAVAESHGKAFDGALKELGGSGVDMRSSGAMAFVGAAQELASRSREITGIEVAI